MSSPADPGPAPRAPKGPPPQEDRSFLGHPRGLATLFLTEMWERFSFYGMRALFVLYFSASVSDSGVGLSPATATALYGVYNALIYMLSMPGGWVADRMWGPRKAVLVGGIVIALGHYTLAIPGIVPTYIGLLLIGLGTGLLKPNISSMVGGLYAPGDKRRDAGFTLFYMSINIGAFFAPLTAGTLGQKVNWHAGFAVAGFGMTIAVLQYWFGRRHLGDIGLTAPQPIDAAGRRRMLWRAALWVGVAALALIVDLALRTFDIEHVVNVLAVLGIVVPLLYFWRMFRDPELVGPERSKVVAFAWFFTAAVVFWLIYEQAGSLLTLFADEKTDRHVAGGWEFPASWFQSVNPAFIVALAPVFAALWQWLGTRQPSTPVKFAYALLLIGLSFVLMGIAGAAASGGGRVTIWWLVAVYFVQTCAELCLSPVGLSVSTRLAPARFTSQIMGLWFLATSTGNALNGWVTRLNGVLGDVGYYTLEGALAVLAGLLMLAAAKRVRALMGDVR